MELLTLLGFLAGTITSAGFIPQLWRGYRTKKLDDVSYFMPGISALGMSFWFLYGAMKNDIAIITANVFGIGCCLLLILLKKMYQEKKPHKNSSFLVRTR